MNQSNRYAAAGVDIQAGDQAKKSIAQIVESTHTPRVLHKEGAFGGLFSLLNMPEKNPVLVSSVDGVGTKVKLASAMKNHKGIGQDIVNHCIDDIMTCGARPLFFLDYFACEKLDKDALLQVIEGMSLACKNAKMALIGGETAQMSDVYRPGEYDLAGTIVGIVDHDDIIDGKKICPGDVLMGLPSSGLHTNGYTLARKVLLEESPYSLDEIIPLLEKPLGDVLLEPHRSYLPEFTAIKNQVQIKGIAHITGGGFEGNINRVLPTGCKAVIETASWKPSPIFTLLGERGNIDKQEMYQVFNMGIGIVFIVSENEAEKFQKELPESINVGNIIEGDGVEVRFP